jgi:hypothetical protein
MAIICGGDESTIYLKVAMLLQQEMVNQQKLKMVVQKISV